MVKIDDWDLRYLGLAKHVSQWSKDPSTKCGAAIVRQDNTNASIGYNGFPRRILDKPALLENREEKYKRVIHAEMNAILNAKEPLIGMTLYVYPFMTCERCAVHVIQSGISRVVSIRNNYPHNPKWLDSFDLAQSLYDEAGVMVSLYEASDAFLE